MWHTGDVLEMRGNHWEADVEDIKAVRYLTSNLLQVEIMSHWFVSVIKYASKTFQICKSCNNN